MKKRKYKNPMKWGVFKKGGWQCFTLCSTKEEAEACVNSRKEFQLHYEVRELLDI